MKATKIMYVVRRNDGLFYAGGTRFDNDALHTRWNKLIDAAWLFTEEPESDFFGDEARALPVTVTIELEKEPTS